MKNFFLQKILLLLVLLTFSRCEIDFSQGYTFVYSRPEEPEVDTVFLDILAVRGVEGGLSFSDDGKKLYGFNVVYDYTICNTISKKIEWDSLVMTEVIFHLKEYTEKSATYTNTTSDVPFTITIEYLTDETVNFSFVAERKDLYVYYTDEHAYGELYTLPALPSDVEIDVLKYYDSDDKLYYEVSTDLRVLYEPTNTKYYYYSYININTIGYTYGYNFTAFDMKENTVSAIQITMNAGIGSEYDRFYVPMKYNKQLESEQVYK